MPTVKQHQAELERILVRAKPDFKESTAYAPTSMSATIETTVTQMQPVLILKEVIFVNVRKDFMEMERLVRKVSCQTNSLHSELIILCSSVHSQNKLTPKCGSKTKNELIFRVVSF